MKFFIKSRIVFMLLLSILLISLASSLEQEEIDNDNDGYNSTIDCNDSNSLVWQKIVGYNDRDGDGFGESFESTFCELNLPEGYVNESRDCADTNPSINPGSLEICNNIDDNCNGEIDETFPNKSEICYVGIGECKKEGLIVCNGETTFCRGVAKKPSSEICDGKDNDCDGAIDEENICYDIENITLDVFSPSQTVYNKNSISINLSISLETLKAKKITYTDGSSKEISLCEKCREYGFYYKKTINFKDGLHNLTLKAYLNDTTVITYLTSFVVDGKKPRLYLPTLRKTTYTNGTFFINYDETNLKDITLFYENENITYSNCTSGKRQVCKLEVNLTNYSGNDITYKFLIRDIADNYFITNNMTAKVDTTPPVLESLEYPIIGNHVFFRFNITEENFKSISFYDNSEKNPRWRILCSVLKNNICEKQQRFSPGEHNLTIKVTDRADNSVLFFI